MPAGDGGQGEGSGSDAEGCKRTCTNDACKGTMANPIPRGMQWVVKERESTLGCCANKGGMCDLCCPPGASEVAPPPLRESASESADSSAGGSGSVFCDGATTEWDAESKSCVPKKEGAASPADFCGEATKWDAAKQKCVGGVEAVGAKAGGETDNNDAAGSEEASEGGSEGGSEEGSGSGSGSGDDSANTTTYHKIAEGGCADISLGPSVGDCPTSLLVKEGQLATGSCASQGYTKAGATVPQDTGPCGTIHFKTFEKAEVGAVVKAAVAAVMNAGGSGS